MTSGMLKGGFVAAVAFAALTALPGFAQDKPTVGLITKTDTNPFFVKMQRRRRGQGQGARRRRCKTCAGKYRRRQRRPGRGDREPDLGRRQGLLHRAERLQGDRADDQEGARRRPAGDRARHAARPDRRRRRDLRHRQLQGRQADRRSGRKGTLGDKAKDAKIAFLDLATNQPTVDFLRDQGFMKGFGIDVKDPNKYGDEDDPRICGHEITSGDRGEAAARRWRTLLQKCPDINVVYTINEPAAAGAYEALKAAGKDDGSVLIVSVDGGCPGVKNVKAGVIGATSQQYPLQDGVDGARGDRQFAKDGQADRPDGRLLRHRRDADHRQAGRRRALDHRSRKA